MQRKDPILAAVLGFAFGGFGLMYISLAQGAVALVILVVIGGITGGFAAPFIWLGCGFWGFNAAKNFNALHEADGVGDDDLLMWERAQSLPKAPPVPASSFSMSSPTTGHQAPRASEPAAPASFAPRAGFSAAPRAGLSSAPRAGLSAAPSAAAPAPAAAPKVAVSFCTQCGAQARSGSRFCGNCGSPIA